jgi:hypothetical protein
MRKPLSNITKTKTFRAHVWIAHQRYPTKGRVWHPGGAHPFIGMDEAKQEALEVVNLIKDRAELQLGAGERFWNVP